MPVCAECLKRLPSSKALMIHLTKVHRFNALSDYKCGEKGCRRKFSSSKAFVRHVKKHDPSEDSENNFVLEPQAALVVPVDVQENEDTLNEPLPLVSASDKTIQSEVMQQADALVCKYYAKPSLPRNIVQNIVDDTSEFLCNGIAMITLKDKVVQALESCQAEPSVVGEITSMFESVQNPFSHLQTEYQRMKHFTNLGTYIAPVPFELGKKLGPVRTKTNVKYKWVAAKAVHVPLAPVLKKFLALPDALSCILNYMESLMKDAETISNFIQCEIWKEKRQKFTATDIVFPLFVYFDDFEANNNLGPHCCKIGGVYVSIGCLPPEIASRIENIFLSILFYAEDREIFKAKEVIKPLLKELRDMEKEGVVVRQSSGVEVKVYFIMCLLLGDNLGIHQLCGFVCGFAWANFPCRFCKVRQDIMKYNLYLDASLLRNKQNYDEDVQLKDQARTGIKEACAMNTPDSFHVTENYEGDILHDFDEGIAHNVMTFVISKLTTAKSKKEPAVFTLATLNRRLQLFNFGTHSALYKTKLCIRVEDLEKGKLKMTGSETQCFVRNFGILMGDLVEESNEYWKLYLCLQRVYDIVVAKHLPRSSVESLYYYVQELGREYLSHDGNTLTFKFHKILWHYASVIKRSGPVANLSTRRYESKHRQSKLGLYTNMSRVFVLLSMAIKHQLGLSHRFVANKSVLPDIDVGSGSVLADEEIRSLHAFIDTLTAIFPDLETVFVPTWIDYKGSHYDNQSTVVIDIDEDIGWPIFGEIKRIYTCGKKVALLCEKLETIGFYVHFHAYEVKRSKQNVCVDIESLADPLPLNTLRAPKGGQYVILRYQV